MKACVLAIDAKSGTGTQACDNVVLDSSGAPFTPTFAIIQSAYAASDTLTFGPTYPDNSSCEFVGADNGSVRSARASATASNSGGKINAVGESLGDYSILDESSRAAFGGDINRKAKLTNFRSGGFDIEYDQNDRTGDVLLITVFGDSDLTIEPQSQILNGTYTTSAKPQGLLAINLPALQSSGSTSSGSGGWVAGFGWETRGSLRGSGQIVNVNQDTNYVGQRTDCFALAINDSGVLSADRPIVSSWDGLGYTVSGNAATDQVALAFCGDVIITAAGTVTQPTSIGVQAISTGINAAWIVFLSTGRAATNTVHTPEFQWARGWADGTRQSGLWVGDSTPGNAGPFTGARYLSTSHVVQFGTPDGGSTAFTASAKVTSIAPTGSVELTWDVVDGIEREVLWFAVGTSIPGPEPFPPGPTATMPMRKLRRSTTFSTDKLWNFFNRFQLDFQAGGPRDGSTPIEICLRYSDDNGNTWSDELWQTVDSLGNYTAICQWFQLGRGRDRVWEVSSSSDVMTVWLAAYIDYSAGTHG